MLAHGFTVDVLVELVRAGLATARAVRVRAGSRATEVARVRITEAQESKTPRRSTTPEPLKIRPPPMGKVVIFFLMRLKVIN